MDGAIIANTFNEYFTHIGPNLAAKIPQVPGSHLEYVKTNVKKSMFIKPTTVFEIKRLSLNFMVVKVTVTIACQLRLLKQFLNIYVHLCVICLIFHLFLVVFQIV